MSKKMTTFWKVGVILAASLCLVSCASATDTPESSSSPADTLLVESDGNVTNLDQEPTAAPTPTTETVTTEPAPADVTHEAIPSDEAMASDAAVLPSNPAGCNDSPSLGRLHHFTDGTTYATDPTLASQLGVDGLYAVYENCSSYGYVAAGTIGSYCPFALVDYFETAPLEYGLEIYRSDVYSYNNVDPLPVTELSVLLDAYESVCSTPGAGLSL